MGHPISSPTATNPDQPSQQPPSMADNAEDKWIQDYLKQLEDLED
eukprot:SAG31_NODE_16840_length_693_cov_1.441077_1_plen_45_part_00